MAEYRTQKTGPGIVIFVALMALIALSIVVGKFSFFHKERDITIYLDSVSGVKDRTAVVYAGQKVGAIHKIRILQPQESKVRVVPKGDSPTLTQTNHYYVEVIARVAEDTPVNQDTKASVMMVGMLGDKQLDLAPGDPNAPPLKAGDALYGENAGMERIVTMGRKLVVKLEFMMEHLQTLLTQVNGVVKDPLFQDNLKGVIANARTTLEKAGVTLAEVKEVLGENRENIKGTMGNVRELTDKGKTTIASLNDTLGDARPKLSATLDNVQKLTTDIRPKVSNVMDKAGATLGKAHDTLDTTHGLLSDNRENISVMLAHFRDMSRNTKHFTHTMRMVFAPWSAFSGDKKPQPKPPGERGEVKVPPADEKTGGSKKAEVPDATTNAPPAQVAPPAPAAEPAKTEPPLQQR